jgi:aldose sugar dehydrogenase
MNIRTTSAPETRAVANLTRCFCAVVFLAAIADRAPAQNPGPQLVDSNLSVRPVVGGLAAPISMAFLGANDFFVLEKSSGKVLRVVNGVVTATVLDLPVNFASERGLLGIALHPNFPRNPGVYLYWTESTTGGDSEALANVELLGNRVDRFTWNGSTLTPEKNIIRLRARQEDATNPAPRGNHNGGVLRFGPDGKLYIYMGDNGRRGQLQNLPDGPGPAGNQPDDQFGGPEPDNAHLTGVILRLNDDGTAPESNPFYKAGAKRGGEVGANLQKIFAYGIRNGFGMAFDPESGRLWEAQNGDDSFTEINQVERGANLGWVQIMGPLSRIAQFKQIETSPAPLFGLQQVRWSPENIATTREDALARLFMIYEDGNEFGADLTGGEEVPPVQTDGRGVARLELRSDGTLRFELSATRTIQQVTAAHIHLGGIGQNGPVVALLFQNAAGQTFQRGDLIARGTLTNADLTARPSFTPTVANLVQRIKDGRAYINVHTLTKPDGEIRGQLVVIDEDPVSHYSDPEFSWKFEIAPAGVGFVRGRELGPQYRGDMIIGGAVTTIQGGHLFRLQLTGNGEKIGVDDPRLEDRVADNLAKYDLTESESLLFGTGFGVGTDIHTGPNGNLFIVSLTHGVVYEISRR